MKVPREKQVSFLQKAISDTMNGYMSWIRKTSNSIDASHVFYDVQLDQEGIYVCRLPSELNGQLWIAMGLDGRVRGAVGYAMDSMEYFSYKDTEIGVLLTRLFYLLYDAHPNINNLIDSFLAQEHQQDSEDSE